MNRLKGSMLHQVSGRSKGIVMVWIDGIVYVVALLVGTMYMYLHVHNLKFHSALDACHDEKLHVCMGKLMH